MSCPEIGNIDISIAMEIDEPNLIDFRWKEVSGTAMSLTQKGPSGAPVIFGHNDGPGSFPIFAAWDSGSGKRLKTFNISTASSLPIFNYDWEDMTIGSCGRTSASNYEDKDCLYIADVGDNRAQGSGQKTQRPSNRPYTIYKVFEPQLDDFISDNPVLSAFRYISVLQIDYRHETSPTEFANSEAIFLDHTGSGHGESIGDIYLVTKWKGSNTQIFTRLFKIPASVWPPRNEVKQYSPEAVGDYDAYSDQKNPFFNKTWTGAGMSPDGSMIALTSTNTTHIYSRCHGTSVAESLIFSGVGSCASYINPAEGANPGKQYESVSFSPDSKTIINIAESRDPAKIVHVDLDFSVVFAAKLQCPEVPAENPTTFPSLSPTLIHSTSPTSMPSMSPTKFPSNMPTTVESSKPSFLPTVTSAPTNPFIIIDLEGGSSEQGEDSSAFGVAPGSLLLLFVMFVCFTVLR